MKIPTSCETLKSDLKAYLDGELSPPRRLLVRAHLMRCAECRAEVEFMKIIGHDLREDETTRPAAFGDVLRQRILDKLPAAPPTFDRAKLRHPLRHSWTQFALVGGLGMLLVVSTLTVMGRRISNTFNSASSQMSDYVHETEDRAIATRMNRVPASAGSTGTMASDSINAAKSSAPRFSDKRFTSESSGKATFSPKNSDGLSVDSRIRGEMQQSRQRIAGLAPGAAPVAGASNTDSLPSIFRRVHREARMTVAVDDIEAQSDNVEQLVRGAGGYVVSNNLSTGSDNRKTATLDLRVPVSRFETIIGEFARLGNVRAKTVSGQDITEQYSDSQQAKNVIFNDLAIRDAQLKAALAKAEASAKRHRQALEDPWQLRAEVRRLRIEAAQVRARLEILRKLSDLSQISIELQEKKAAPEKGGFNKEMRDSGQAATDTFLAAARLPLKFLLWAFAYSPLWLPFVLFYRWLFPRRVNSGQPSAAPHD